VVLPQYELTWLPAGFEPAAMDSAERVGETIRTDSAFVAAIYDPSSGTMERIVGSFFSDSAVLAMNARGDVVGTASADPRYSHYGSGMHAFVRYADGNALAFILTSEHGMPVTSGAAVAIDGNGVAYGYAGLLRTGSSASFSLVPGSEMFLFGDEHDTILAVSPSGMLVGCRDSRPVFFRDGEAIEIAPGEPGISGCLKAVNDAGIAVGGFQDGGNRGAYVWNGTTTTSLPLVAANSINAAGWVAGARAVEDLRTHAALWLGQADVRDLNDLVKLEDGVELTEAVIINDAGAIAGTSSKGAFLLSPKR